MARSLVAALLALVAVLGESGRAAAVELVSYRAAYRLSLAEADAASGVSEVEGGLVMEWRAGCDGWISNQRLGFVASASEGPGFSYDVRFTSWESLDGTRLRFNVRSYDDGGMTDQYRGEASLERPGGSGQARYGEPAGEVVELPAGTLFPTGHVRNLIEQAQQGRLVVTSDVFDGSGPKALTRVTAIIGKPQPAPAAAGTIGTAARRWPVGLAYYNLIGGSETPDFELGFTIGEDGVLYDIRLDYGDFTLDGKLEKLETFPGSGCD